MAESIKAGADTIDVRDVIARIEELETTPEEGGEELQGLLDFMDDLKNEGGEDEWRGAWYPLLLIEELHFEDFAREEAENIHNKVLRVYVWPFCCIDWKQAAKELQQEYSSVEYDRYTYWYR